MRLRRKDRNEGKEGARKQGMDTWTGGNGEVMPRLKIRPALLGRRRGQGLARQWKTQGGAPQIH